MATTSKNSPDSSGAVAPHPPTSARAGGRKSAGTRTSAGSRTTSARRTTTPRKQAASSTTSTQPRTPVEQVVSIASRVVLVPVGAGLSVRDDLVSTVKDMATRYSTRKGLERELQRYEKRGAAVRNRLEKQVGRTRSRFGHDLRARSRDLERTVRDGRRQLEREVRNVRRDIDRQSKLVTNQVEKLVSSASGLIT